MSINIAQTQGFQLHRARTDGILKDLEQKMVFIVGPRQVGKTWLATEVSKRFSRVMYLNYDDPKDRAVIHAQAWTPRTELLVLDELHKMKGWKNFLKGVYDTRPTGMRMLITGSARLDIFRQMGDSLAGRFFVHHLMPLSLAELVGQGLPQHLVTVDRLIVRGGFPEPFLAESDEASKRWRFAYADSLTREDVFDIAGVDNVQNLRRVFELLRHKVGSPISYSAIARDIAVSSVTVKKYIQILEALYLVFSIRPYTHKIARSILKEPKVYFYDTGMVLGDEGVQFENLVGVSLLKHVLSKQDMAGANVELAYLRTKNGHEVDFVVVDRDAQKPTLAVEAKHADHTLAPHLQYFLERYAIDAGVQVVQHIRHERQVTPKIEIRDAYGFLSELS